MAESKPSASPIDHVRRDSRDSAYHCPQCDTPFTRRSNLRRHFQIHMRSAVYKCEKCTDEFMTKEEAQVHSLTCLSNSNSGMDWNSPNDNRTTRVSMQQPYHLKSNSYPGTLSSTMTSSTQSIPHNMLGHGAYIPPPVVPSANFDTAETHFSNHYAGPSYSQSLTPLHASTSAAPTSSGLPTSFDGNFIHPSSPPSSYSHRRPSTSSSISSSSTSSSYQHALAHAQGAGCTCPACVNGGRALERTPWHGLTTTPTSPLSSMEEPIYTRRQVKDMIDVVSDCLIETMGDVLTRPHGNVQTEPPNGHLIRSIRDDGFRRTVLSEALPRVYYRIHGGDHKP